MPGTIPAARQHLIDDIAKLARRMRGAPLPLPAFVQAYYRGVGEEDLQLRDAAAFAAAAAGHLEFERSLLESLPSSDRAALDRLLGLLTLRAESLSLQLREDREVPRVRKGRRPQTRRTPVR